MIKKCLFYSIIAFSVAFISQGFKPLEPKNQNWFFNDENTNNLHLFPSPEVTDYDTSNTPLAGKSFTGFKEALGFKESQGKYQLVNTLGYMGKYQFGISSLKAIGIKNTNQFLNNPHLQEKAFVALLAVNKNELLNEINKFEGKFIQGVKVTESGILAAAHLGGAGSVKKFLHSNGKRAFKDAFGTSILTYMKNFGGYDTSFIEANANPEI